MTSTVYEQVDATRYNIIMSRYDKYLDALNDVNKDPVRVFDALSQKQVDELHLIRQVSAELQKKKDDDIKKAAQAAEEAAQSQEEKEKKEEEDQENVKSE